MQLLLLPPPPPPLPPPLLISLLLLLLLISLLLSPNHGRATKKLIARRLVRRVLEERLRELVVRVLPDDAREGLLTAYASAI